MDANNSDSFKLRFANEADTDIIYLFIKELAEYENLSDEVTANESVLHNSLFVKKSAEVLLGEYEGKVVAFALFFHNFSTFLGKPGIYLEDLFVKPEYRKLGFGKKILSYLCKLAVERDCGRVEWWCLDWNKKSIDFYLRCGAEAMSDWTVYRLHGENMKLMAETCLQV